MSNWRPIDSAPKDGSSVFVIDDGALTPMPGVAHWFCGDWRAGHAFEWQVQEEPEEYLGYYPTPSRWHPMPTTD